MYELLNYYYYYYYYYCYYQVDTHNICPVRKVSNKCEFAARTIRGKIHALVSEYLTEFPSVQVMDRGIMRSHNWTSPDITPKNQPIITTSTTTTTTTEIDTNDDIKVDSDDEISPSLIVGNKEIWQTMAEYIRNIDRSVPEVSWLESGEHAAMEALNDFLGIISNEENSNNNTTIITTTSRRTSRLDEFSEKRNDPSIVKGCSGLSPYLHFGQISSQRICLEVCLVSLQLYLSFNSVSFIFLTILFTL